LGELHGLREHAAALLRRGRQHHPRAEETHELAALDAEVLGHRDDERIALTRADHREPDAGIAARGFDHGLTGAQLAGALGILDHAEREAILHRAHRVEGFDLDEEVDAGRREGVHAHDGSSSYRREYVVVALTHGNLRVAARALAARLLPDAHHAFLRRRSDELAVLREKAAE